MATFISQRYPSYRIELRQTRTIVEFANGRLVSSKTGGGYPGSCSEAEAEALREVIDDGYVEGVVEQDEAVIAAFEEIARREQKAAEKAAQRREQRNKRRNELADPVA